jgi:hypothetical protein
MEEPSGSVDLTPEEFEAERKAYERVLCAFANYAEDQAIFLNQWRKEWHHTAESQRRLVPTYSERLDAIEKGIEANASFIHDLLSADNFASEIFADVRRWSVTQLPGMDY